MSVEVVDAADGEYVVEYCAVTKVHRMVCNSKPGKREDPIFVKLCAIIRSGAID